MRYIFNIILGVSIKQVFAIRLSVLLNLLKHFKLIVKRLLENMWNRTFVFNKKKRNSTFSLIKNSGSEEEPITKNPEGEPIS